MLSYQKDQVGLFLDDKNKIVIVIAGRQVMGNFMFTMARNIIVVIL